MEAAPDEPRGESHAPRVAAPVAPRKSSPAAKPRFSRSTPVHAGSAHARDRQPAQSSSNGRTARYGKAASAARHSGTRAGAASARHAHATGSNGSKAASHGIGKTASASRNGRQRVVTTGAKPGGKRFGFSGSSRTRQGTRQGTRKRG